MLDNKGFEILVFGLVALIFSAPMADRGDEGRALFQAGFLAIVLLAMNLSKVRAHWRLLLAIEIGAGFIVLFVADWFDSQPAKLVGAGIVIAICISVFVHVGRRVIAAPHVDANIISGGIACYFLIAIVWALGFALIDGISPGSFNWGKEGPATVSELVYFSLTCVSTLGFGDVLPVSPFARIFSAFETIAGTIYLSVFVARLVSLYRR